MCDHWVVEYKLSDISLSVFRASDDVILRPAVTFSHTVHSID